MLALKVSQTVQNFTTLGLQNFMKVNYIIALYLTDGKEARKKIHNIEGWNFSFSHFVTKKIVFSSYVENCFKKITFINLRKYFKFSFISQVFDVNAPI